jgi:hypothetical protein
MHKLHEILLSTKEAAEQQLHAVLVAAVCVDRLDYVAVSRVSIQCCSSWHKRICMQKVPY